MKKKLITFCMVLCMLVSIFSMNAEAETATLSSNVLKQEKDSANNAELTLTSTTAGLKYRWGTYQNGTWSEDKTNSLSDSLIVSPGSVIVFLYFVDASGETLLRAEDVTTTNSNVLSIGQSVDNADAVEIMVNGFGTEYVTYTKDGQTYNLTVTSDIPTVGFYKSTVASQSDYLTEFKVTDTDNEFYLVPSSDSNLTIQSVELEDVFAKIATAKLSSDGNYVKVVVTGNPQDGYYGGLAINCINGDGNTEKIYAPGIVLTNSKSYIGICWSDLANETEPEPISRGWRTFKGLATDVWAYYIDGTTGKATKLSEKELKASDESILKISDSKYVEGMVRLETIGWGETAITYTKDGITYPMYVESDVDRFGFYNKLEISQDNWIREFDVTEENNTFYFIADDGFIFDEIIPTEALKEIATIELSEDKTYVKITVTGVPKQDERYGIESFKAHHPDGEVMEAGYAVSSRITLIAPVVVEVSDKAQNAVDKEFQNIIADILQGKAVDEEILDIETQKRLEKVLQEGRNVFTVISVEPIDKEDALKLYGEDYTFFEKKIGAKGILHQFLDISILIIAENSDGESDVIGTVNKVKKPITYTVKLSEGIERENRKFSILRRHRGELSVLDVKMNKDGSMSFTTDCYSSYALISEPMETKVPSGSSIAEAEPENESVAEKDTAELVQVSVVTPVTSTKPAATGDNADILGICMTMAICVMAIVFFAGKKNHF